MTVKKLLILLVITMLTIPAVGLADPKIDFNAKCAKCHRTNKNFSKQAKSLGVDPGKLVLKPSEKNRSEMIAIIEKGRDKMPGFEKELTKEQITDIVDYLIALRNRKK